MSDVVTNRHGVHITLDRESYNNIVRTLNHVTGRTLQGTLSGAVNATLKYSAKKLSRDAKKRYINSAWVRNIAVKGKSGGYTIQKAKASNGGMDGILTYRSVQPSLNRFMAPSLDGYKYPDGYTRTKLLLGGNRTRYINFKSQRRPNGPGVFMDVAGQNKFKLYGTQIKGHRKPLRHDFVFTAKNGHVGIAHRGDGKGISKMKTVDSKRYGILQALGSSYMKMIDNPHIWGKDEGDLNKRFLEEIDKRVERALAKG